MRRRLGRTAQTRWRWALLTLLFVFALSGNGFAASIRFIAESDTPFERRLAAEIESVGFEVERPETPELRLPESTAAIVYVRNDPPQVELWLLGDTGKFELSSVVRDDVRTPDDEDDTSALRIAERLRALLQPVYVQAQAAEAAARSQAPQPKPAPVSAPPPSVSTPPPSVSAPPPTPGRPARREPASDPKRRFTAAIGLGLGQHTSDVIPQATLEFDYAPLASLGLGALVVLPLQKASIEADGDRAELEAWMGGVHGFARVSPLERLELQLGAGVLAAYVRAEGDADSPRFGRSVSGTRWVPFLEGAAAYEFSPEWLLRAAALVGRGLPDTPIEFAGETVAQWGEPWILTQLSLGYAW